MGRQSVPKLHLLFAAWTFLAVVAVMVPIVAVRLGMIRAEEEQAAADLAAGTVAPLLAASASELAADGVSASFASAAADVLSEGVREVRVWNPDGRLLASTGGGEARADDAALAAAAGGAVTARREATADGNVLATYSSVVPGAALELRLDYGPIAGAIGRGQRGLILVAGAGGVATFAVLQLVFWVVLRSLQSEYARLRYLYRTGQAVRSTLDISDVLEQLSRDAVLLTRGQVAFATLVEEETGDLILKASYERAGGTSAQHHRRVEEWFLRRCAVTDETITALERSLSFRSVLGLEGDQQQHAYLLAVPISNRDRAIGVLTVLRNRSSGAFTTSEVEMVGEMAAQAAMAVEQAILFGKMRSYASEIELSYDSTLKVLMAALDVKDSGTQGHSERVSRLTVSLAKQVGIPQERMADMERGALLHDVGKIGVPDEVLRKPDTLNEGEWEAMQKHPLLAGLMVSKVGFLEGAMPILLYHHEHYDGSGYPFGLEGDAIPLEARIFTVVDAYDAMTTDRPYRKAFSPERALEEIQRNADTQFDPEVVDAFTQVVARMQPVSDQAA